MLGQHEMADFVRDHPAEQVADLALVPRGKRGDPVREDVGARAVLDGLAAPTFDVPANPALSGLDVRWQSLAGAPPAFSNRATTPIHGP